MISHDHRCIFVHIPKTAGTSIENAIWGDDWSVRTEAQLWMGSEGGVNQYQTGGLQHLLASQIRQAVGSDIFSSYFKFAIVRNPWDKVVSQYHYIKTRPDILRCMELKKWCTFGMYLRALKTRKLQHVQSMDQHLFINDKSGQRLVDYVGFFENLQHDFTHISHRLGLGSTELPHAFRSNRKKNYHDYYSTRAKNLIAELYKEDIKLFGYRFE